jgi:hypothetical protein
MARVGVRARVAPARAVLRVDVLRMRGRMARAREAEVRRVNGRVGRREPRAVVLVGRALVLERAALRVSVRGVRIRRVGVRTARGVLKRVLIGARAPRVGPMGGLMGVLRIAIPASNASRCGGLVRRATR